jgi:hypothetical protein
MLLQTYHGRFVRKITRDLRTPCFIKANNFRQRVGKSVADVIRHSYEKRLEYYLYSYLYGMRPYSLNKSPHAWLGYELIKSVAAHYTVAWR